MPRRTRTTYHHGDLRRALIDAAIPLLRDGGPKALTLRAVARAAGVSQAAPYRHFADRAALVAAVADDGFQRLQARLLEAVRREASRRSVPGRTARAGLQSLAIAYVEFAMDHPAEYRVMFGPEIAANPGNSPDSRARVFDFLRQGIAMLQAQRLVRPGDPHAMALTAWALVHGLAMLILDGQVGARGRASHAELTREATELLMFGMAG
jgi:AcrR family transcriptional regulator